MTLVNELNNVTFSDAFTHLDQQSTRRLYTRRDLEHGFGKKNDFRVGTLG